MFLFLIFHPVPRSSLSSSPFVLLSFLFSFLLLLLPPVIFWTKISLSLPCYCSFGLLFFYTKTYYPMTFSPYLFISYLHYLLVFSYSYYFFSPPPPPYFPFFLHRFFRFLFFLLLHFCMFISSPLSPPFIFLFHP